LKPNLNFKLSTSDIEIIEYALLNSISTANERQDFTRIKNITELLGKLHDQKNFYGKMPDGSVYVGG
jgi:hypothetical protein